MSTTGDTDATRAATSGTAPDPSSPSEKSDTFLQDIMDSWDERHTKRTDISYRIVEAKTAMRRAGWAPRVVITVKNRRAADQYLSAKYRHGEARADRRASAASALNVSSAASGLVVGMWGTLVSGLASATAAAISLPCLIGMWRLKRFSIRHQELRELDATVHSRPDTRRELIDSRAAVHVKAAGHPDPVDFSEKMSWLFRLDEPPLTTLSPKDAANRASVERLVKNAMHSAREAYLDDSNELYLSNEAMQAWEGAGHNSTTTDPSLGGRIVSPGD